MVKSKAVSDRILSLVCHVLVTMGVLLCLLPIVHTLALSLSDKASATAGLVGLWPVNFTGAAYAAILRDKQFFTALGNSLLRVGLGVLMGRFWGFGVLGIWMAMFFDWILRAVLFVIRFRGHKWETMGLTE